MEIKDTFLERETRLDFTIEPMMKRAWAASMEVLCEIERICKKYEIQYFADWGTLLGAVRHEGFIPWDDDIDITMKRPDYMKFLQVAPKELRAPFEIISIYTDEAWDNMLSRVINGRSINVQPDYLKKFHGCPYVVGIDIFPLDYASRDEEETQIQLDMVNIVLHAAAVERLYKNGECEKEERDALVEQVEELCNVKLDSSKSIEQQLRILGDQLAMLYHEDEADELGIVLSRITNRPNYHFPKEYYAESIDKKFEDMVVPVPVGYDEILKLKYGEQYMIPNKEWLAHDYPFYKEQEKILAKELKRSGVSGEQFGIASE